MTKPRLNLTHFCMAEGVERRSQIDTETAKALLLINGGGAVALLAFLPAISGNEQFEILIKPVAVALLIYQFGLIFAVTHNHLRRRCSLIYSTGKASVSRCAVFGHTLKEPCLCYWSWGCMLLSGAAFLTAGFIVFFGLMHTEAQLSHAEQVNVPSSSTPTPR